MSKAKITKFQREIHRLGVLRSHLFRDKSRVKYALPLFLLVPIAYVVMGNSISAAVITHLFVMSFFAICYYLIKVRIREYSIEMELLQDQVDKLLEEAELATAA